DVGAGAAQIKLALAAAPDDPFILRTAAQIVAWYDTQTDRSKLSKDDTQTIEWLRTSAQQKPEFAEAYRAALQRNRGAAGTQPATSQDTTAYGAENPPIDVPAAETYPPQYYGGATYVNPYYPGYTYVNRYDYLYDPYWCNGGFW